MQEQNKPKQPPQQKNKKIITEQERKVITQRMQLIHKNHPDCIPVLFLKHPQAPNNIKPPTTPFILFQKKWKIEQAMISLYNQIKQKGLYFFCPYLEKDKLKYSVLKPGPTIQEVYKKFGTGGYLTLVYSDGNLGMQGMMTMQKWMIRLLIMIILIWVFIYGYSYYNSYYGQSSTQSSQKINPDHTSYNNTQF